MEEKQEFKKLGARGFLKFAASRCRFFLLVYSRKKLDSTCVQRCILKCFGFPINLEHTQDIDEQMYVYVDQVLKSTGISRVFMRSCS